MGRLASAFAQKSAIPRDLLRELLNGQRTSSSGKIVTTKTALEVATVLRCARVIANGIAQVPLKIMEEAPDGKSRLPAKSHPLYKIFGRRPNDWQTAFEYREMIGLHLVLCANHYSFINRSNRAGIMELVPFEPGSVTVRRADDTTLTYEVRAQNGSSQIFPAKAIWHLRGPSWNSWMGLEAVQLAREAIGLAMATEEQQGKMQKSGVQTAGVYSVEGKLTPKQYADLRTWIDENHAGAENAGKAMILDNGAKWLNQSMTGIDAQTIETRRFQVEEMCRHLGVNPIMVFAESKNTTYASAEQMFLAHLVHTLAPEYARIEQSIDANLLTEAEYDRGLYANFVEEGLLRGSAVDTKETLLGYVNGGLMTPNEGRSKLDMNPDADPASDKLRVPANITGSVPAAKPEGTP